MDLEMKFGNQKRIFKYKKKIQKENQNFLNKQKQIIYKIQYKI